jgi:hypothetical protein
MGMYKTALITGAGGFCLSLLIALMSRVRLPMLLLRPLLFGVIFCLIGGGAFFLYRRFLAGFSENEQNAYGNNVDISVDDGDTDMMVSRGGSDLDLAGFVETDRPDFSDEQGNVVAANSFMHHAQGLEQNQRTVYTNGGEGIDSSFRPMEFRGLNTDAFSEASYTKDIPSRGNRKVLARVSEADNIADADPKKLANVVQDLLLDK